MKGGKQDAVILSPTQLNAFRLVEAHSRLHPTSSLDIEEYLATRVNTLFIKNWTS